MSNFETRVKFNVGINTAYSANYTCLRIADQEKAFNPVNKIYTREDIFNKNPDELWISKKLNSASNLRIKKLNLLQSSISHEDESFKDLARELENAKKIFIRSYNEYYDKDKKFEDVVTGFVCHDEKFDNLARLFITTGCAVIQDAKLDNVVTNYLYYIDLYEKYTLLETFCDLISQLSFSLTDRGRQSVFYNEPKNPLIKKISRDEIFDFIKVSATVLCDRENEFKQTYKELLKAYKIGSKKSSNIYDSANKVNNLTAKISNADLLYVIAKELFNFSTELELRLESANTDDSSLAMSHLSEKIADFMSGVDVFNNDKFVVNEIYVHQYEFDYINFLFNLLQTSPEKIKAEHSEKQINKSAKQKGE